MTSRSLFEIIDGMYTSVIEAFGDLSTINSLNIINVLTFVMELAERHNTLRGTEKKEITRLLVTRIMEELPLESDEKALIHESVGRVLPNLIDVIVAATKGHFSINKKDGAPAKHVCCW